MRIFETLQEKYTVLGVSPSQHSTQGHALNAKTLFGFLLFGSSLISILLFISYVANNFMEYVQSICVFCGTIVLFVCFASIVFEMDIFCGIIVDIEKLIDSSKKILYS